MEPNVQSHKKYIFIITIGIAIIIIIYALYSMYGWRKGNLIQNETTGAALSQELVPNITQDMVLGDSPMVLNIYEDQENKGTSVLIYLSEMSQTDLINDYFSHLLRNDWIIKEKVIFSSEQLTEDNYSIDASRKNLNLRIDIFKEANSANKNKNVVSIRVTNLE